MLLLPLLISYSLGQCNNIANKDVTIKMIMKKRHTLESHFYGQGLVDGGGARIQC